MDHFDSVYYNATYSDFDHSFASSATSATTASARSSLALSFHDSSCRLSTSHRRHDNPNWAAVDAAAADGGLRLRHLKLLRLVGSGNLGRVFLCRLRGDERAEFALKVVDRDSLTPKKLCHVETEARVLAGVDHPFLPTLYARIDASHYTCLLMDYCPRGDLHALLQNQPLHRLPADSVRFFAAEVLLALEYLHARGIVYRDLKPENILIRADGHVMLSDFDLCFEADVAPRLENRVRVTAGGGRRRRRREERVTEFVAEPTSAFSRSCVGTHEYLAPEVVGGDGHGGGVDWWAFGVLVYELLYGTTPFKGGSKESTLRNIASARGVRYPAAAVGEGEEEARDLIEKLLVKDPRKRLGCAGGATDIKRHPFFNGIKWALIRTYRPPVKRSKGHVSHVTSPRRRRCFWKKLGRWMRIKKCSLNSNSNYYSYVSYTR